MSGTVVLTCDLARGKPKQGTGEAMANLGYVGIVSSKRREGGKLMDRQQKQFQH